MLLLDQFCWYLGSIGGYVLQMLPCMLIGTVLFGCLRPVRRKRLHDLGLYSGPLRETTLMLFVMFCSGLAALTLFPANLWSYVLQYCLSPDVRQEGLHLSAFYLTKEEFAQRLLGLPDILAPFQEIRRALRHGSWLMFMLWGNIGMFLPIGFCTALLWRKPRWWKSLLAGFAASAWIETVQFFIGRSTDIDDVILNTTGAFAGYVLFLVLHALAPQFTAKFHCRLKEETPQHG